MSRIVRDLESHMEPEASLQVKVRLSRSVLYCIDQKNTSLSAFLEAAAKQALEEEL